MSQLENITAAILAGGLGTRLRSAVADRPKVLAEVSGKPFLAYLLDQLAAAGVQRVVLCTGYMGDRVKEVFGEIRAGLRLVYSQEPSPLGTAGSLRLALPLFESDRVLVMNGDSFCDAGLGDLVDWHGKQDADGTLLLTEVARTDRYGRVRVDDHGRILSFDEKSALAGPGWINAGVYVFSRALLLTIPDSGPVSLEREMFPAWTRSRFYGYRGKGRFLDIGTPESYSLAERFFALRQGAV